MNTDTTELQARLMDAPEWEFQEPPEKVDLDRLWEELRNLQAVFAGSYLEQLRAKAPLTYDRLKAQRLAASCKVFNWQ